MAIAQSFVSDMLVTVKTREVQRGMVAELRGDSASTARHFLAAAHLELVLAEDYSQAGMEDMDWRSRLSAASCFWRGGQIEKAQEVLRTLQNDFPAQAGAVQNVLEELARDYPKKVS